MSKLVDEGERDKGEERDAYLIPVEVYRETPGRGDKRQMAAQMDVYHGYDTGGETGGWGGGGGQCFDQNMTNNSLLQSLSSIL